MTRINRFKQLALRSFKIRTFKAKAQASRIEPLHRKPIKRKSRIAHIKRFLQAFRHAHPWAIKWGKYVATATVLMTLSTWAFAPAGVLYAGQGEVSVELEQEVRMDVVQQLDSIMSNSSMLSFGSVERWLDTSGAAVKMARIIEKEYGTPMWLTLAQGIQESRGGLDELARKGNNYFGHKQHSGKGIDGERDPRGLGKKVLGHQGYKAPQWAFYHHGHTVVAKYLRNISDPNDVREVIDCICAASNGRGEQSGFNYDYAGACAGKSANGKYGYAEFKRDKNGQLMYFRGKPMAGYEHKLMEHVHNHKLLEVK